MTPKFTISVFSGQLIKSEFTAVSDYCATLYDGFYCLSIKSAKEEEIRSNRQNRYLWGVPYKLLSEHLGYTIEEIHDICKYKFLSRPEIIHNIIKHRDEEIVITKSTTILNTADFERYTSSIRQWASELGVFVPEPNEVSYE